MAVNSLIVGGALALFLAFVAHPAAAQDIPDGGLSPQDVVQWLQAAGYQAEIEHNSDGRTEIRSASSGTTFRVYFYDCRGARCASLQFYAGFSMHGNFDLAKENDWNSTKRWTRVYMDKTDDPWIEMDVDLTPGGTYELLNDEFAIWRNMLEQFVKFIDFRS